MKHINKYLSSRGTLKFKTAFTYHTHTQTHTHTHTLPWVPWRKNIYKLGGLFLSKWDTHTVAPGLSDALVRSTVVGSTSAFWGFEAFQDPVYLYSYSRFTAIPIEA